MPRTHMSVLRTIASLTLIIKGLTGIYAVNKSCEEIISYSKKTVVRSCIARCLGLMPLSNEAQNDVPNEPCLYNMESGLVAGPCSETFKPNPKNNKIVLCAVENLENPHVPYDLRKLIRSKMCTHISIYSFFNYDNKSQILTADETLANRVMADIKEAKLHNIKILVRIGGWVGQQLDSDSFAKLVSDSMRSYFVGKITNFVTKYQLDGVFFYWMYPMCRYIQCGKAIHFEEKANYVKLVKEVRDDLPTSILALGLPTSSDFMGGFDMPRLSPLIDIFPVTSFNYIYHGYQIVAISAPFSSVKNNIEVVGKLLQKDYSKVLLGILTKIEIYILTNKNEIKIGSKQLVSKGKTASVDQACKKISKGNMPNRKSETDDNPTTSRDWMCFDPFDEGIFVKRECVWVKNASVTVKRDPVIGNYAAVDKYWFSFEDQNSIGKKIEYLNQIGAAGALVSAVGYDDVNNTCGCGAYPALRIVAELLRGDNGCTLTPCL